jgi:hypothetical protein
VTALADILRDASAEHGELLSRAAAHLHKQPDHGAAEAVEFFRTSDDPDQARVAATYLGLLPNQRSHRTSVVEHGLRRGGLFTRAVTWPLRLAEEQAIDAAVVQYVTDPGAIGTYDLAFESALFFPGALRAHRDEIADEMLSQALLAGAPDSIAADLEAAYRDDPDPQTLRALAAVRTDRALEALIDLRPLVPEHEHALLDLYLESGGVFPDTREASVYPRALLGFVSDREASPHAMGAGFAGPVPECPVCGTPATRVLTVSAGDTPFELRADPSFFWLSCECDSVEYLYVDFAGDRPSGLMVPMTDSEPDQPIVPGRPSLVLEDHPNQHGYGIEVSAEFALHQVGGYPPWIELDRHPVCPRCSRSMRFLAAVDSGPTVFGPMRFEGLLFGFWCDDDAVSCTTRQSDEI